MKRFLWLLIFAFALPLAAQNTRWDYPVYTVQAQGGNLLPVYAIPGAGVVFYSCSGSVCTTLATTYISATSSTTCPTSPTPMQITLNGSSTCVATADPYGNMGAWFQTGQYMATITAQGSSYNYYFTVGGTGGGGGGVDAGLFGQTAIYPGDGATVSGTYTLSTNVNGQINCAAAPYNAVGDCSTDNQTAINACLRAADAPHLANANVPPLEAYFPRPTGGCYKTSTVTYYGEPLRGEAPGNAGGFTPGVLIRGMPGEDVFHVPDPSLTTLPMFYSTWSMNDLAIQVDSSIAASFPHRWPGKWFDDGAMTASSAVFTSSHSFINCDDIGQAIQVNGAGSGGANLVTTIASVTPCWVPNQQTSGPGLFQTVTLTAAASTTVTGAHTYISLLGLPVTAQISNCAFAMDDEDGNTADWPNPSSPGGNAYNQISNVQITSTASHTNHGQCGFFSQGSWAPYGIHVNNFTVSQINYGVMQVMPEINSANQVGGANDVQVWQHGQMEDTVYPWISYNGSGGILRNVQMTAGSGPQFMSAYNLYGESSGFWDLESTGTGELSSGTTTTYGTRLEGSGYYGRGLTFGAPGMTGYIGGIDDNCFLCSTNSNATTVMYIGGANNIFNSPSGNIPVRTKFVDQGIGNRITLGTTPSENSTILSYQPISQLAYTSPTKQSDHANGLSSDFISKGQAGNEYWNPDALWIWPQEFQFTSSFGAGTSTQVADSTSPTGYYIKWNSGAYYYTFQQYSGDNTGQNLVIGNPTLPAISYTAYLWAKCPSGTTSLTWQIKSSSGPSLNSVTASCSTSYALYSMPITNLTTACSGSCVGNYLTFVNNGAGAFDAGWMALRPYQGDYNGQYPVLAPTALAAVGGGPAVPTGPATSTTLDCANFNNTTGQIQDAGFPCGTGTGAGIHGTPSAGDIASFYNSTTIQTATATQVNTLIATLSDCSTATYVYSPQSGTCVAPGTQTICSGQITFNPGAISQGAKSSVTTATCTGLAATDNIMLDFAADPTSTTGYAPTTNGTITIIKYPTTNTINVVAEYNGVLTTITPGSVTLNYRVVR